MAAVTVEDCLKIIPNRFELSLIASYRAKQLMNGATMLYTPEKAEKNTVISLREIGADLLDVKAIRNEIKNNIRNQTLFKSFEDSGVEETKKDSEQSVISNDLGTEMDEEDLDDEELIEDDDDEYYSNLNTEDIGDELSEDIEK